MNDELLDRLGIVVRRGFLSPDHCESIVTSMGVAPRVDSTVVERLTAEDPGAAGAPAVLERVDEGTRRSKLAEVAPDVRSALVDCLEPIVGWAAERFGLPVTGIEGPQFLRYGPGDFFLPHLDDGEGDDEPDRKERFPHRKVSLVVFLDDRAEGGELVFTGLVPGDHEAGWGLAVEREVGTLVAFPSSVMHEVRPVRKGERHTIVAWLHE
jgi:predicted 2-oxoglutarate/Fe(II)-dependent dioxygenase YbiX